MLPWGLAGHTHTPPSSAAFVVCAGILPSPPSNPVCVLSICFPTMFVSSCLGLHLCHPCCRCLLPFASSTSVNFACMLMFFSILASTFAATLPSQPKLRLGFATTLCPCYRSGNKALPRTCRYYCAEHAAVFPGAVFHCRSAGILVAPPSCAISCHRYFLCGHSAGAGPAGRCPSGLSDV